MKCVYCNQEIKYGEPYKLWGYDGDFIHIRCKKPIEDEINKICDMTDEQFNDWMIGK